MDRFQVGDLVLADTGITGRIVTMSKDGQQAYVPGTAVCDYLCGLRDGRPLHRGWALTGYGVPRR
jgi:hypothetical protein